MNEMHTISHLTWHSLSPGVFGGTRHQLSFGSLVVHRCTVLSSHGLLLALWLYPLVHRVATLCQHRIVGLAFNVRSYDFVSWLLLAQVIRQDLEFGLLAILSSLSFGFSANFRWCLPFESDSASSGRLLPSCCRHDVLSCPVMACFCWHKLPDTSQR